MNTLTKREQAVVRFLKSQFDERMAALAAASAGAPPPEVRVENRVDVPAPVVQLTSDPEPVVAALDRLTRAVKALPGELAGVLAEALAKLPPPEVAVSTPERPARTVKIRHSDGSESTIREE